MKSKYLLRKNIIRFFFLFIFFIVLIFETNFQIATALPMENFKNETIVEELRLKVPANFKEVWLEAEKNIWDPWLSGQNGFLGRQIFWDKEKEEALILVKWENKKLWKNISMEEVNEIQKRFEKNVQESLQLNSNPFILIHESELYSQ